MMWDWEKTHSVKMKKSVPLNIIRIICPESFIKGDTI